MCPRVLAGAQVGLHGAGTEQSSNMMRSAPESALVVLVPEAEALVRPVRARYDPSAAQGMPAHVTILYPFQPPRAITPSVLAALQDVCARFSPFQVRLSQLGRFPDVLYLAPVPPGPFQVLTHAIVQRFPETPPYGGRFAEVVPHLTLAQLADGEGLEHVAAEFMQTAGGCLPIEAAVTDVALMDNEPGVWRVRVRFRLGG